MPHYVQARVVDCDHECIFLIFQSGTFTGFEMSFFWEADPNVQENDTIWVSFDVFASYMENKIVHQNDLHVSVTLLNGGEYQRRVPEFNREDTFETSSGFQFWNLDRVRADNYISNQKLFQINPI